GDARPLAATLERRPPIEPEAQGANFVRNHDELTLDKLSDVERAEVFDAFAPDERMRVYDRGIVRRLPPMLDGDPRRVRLVYSLLFSLPGTPVLFYGEEIGMGENLAQDGRQSVRTPMQWTDERNGGFSRAIPSRLVASPPTDGYAPEHVNVEAQMHDPDSLLSFIKRLATRYRSSPEIGWGELDVLPVEAHQVLAHRITADVGRFVAVHNFAPTPVLVPLELGPVAPDAVLSDLFAPDTYPLDERGRIEVHLEAYGYRWFRIVETDDRRLT
ncbi:MAG TPA: trehalose synthase, partial [Agromyces sp.]